MFQNPENAEETVPGKAAKGAAPSSKAAHLSGFPLPTIGAGEAPAGQGTLTSAAAMNNEHTRPAEEMVIHRPSGSAGDDFWNGDEYRRHTSHHRAFDPPVLWDLGLSSGDLVLDVGCGTGDLTVSLADRYPGAQVVGIDASPSQIDAARRHRHPRVRFHVLSVQQLRCHGRFAAVVSIACLHWVAIEDHPSVLENIFGALAPGGHFIASFAEESNVADILDLVSEVADQPPYRSYLQGRPPHHRWPSLPEYRRLLAASPFGSGQRLQAQVQPRRFSHPQLVGWLRTQALTGYRSHLPPALYDALVAQVGEQVAGMTLTGEDVYTIPFARILVHARR